MPNTTISPNMNLPVPVPGTDPGPDWTNNIVADMYAIDAHDHSTGKGVQITPSGLNINDDFPQNNNNITGAKSVRFSAQSAPLSSGSDIGCLYESGVDLYYNDGNGNQVRITQSGSVTGSAGTITGLPSGTASASFAAGTFAFQSATSTPATMAVGPLVIGRNAASSKTVTLSPDAAQASNYSLTFPAATPAANQLLVTDGSGNLSWSFGLVPIGAVVATFPNLTGAYSCTGTTAADAFGFVKCNGQTIADGTSPMNGQVVPNINNTVFLAGSTTAGTSGGSSTATISTSNMPSHTHTFTSSTLVGDSAHTHGMAHTHIWAHAENLNLYSLTSSSTNTTTITTSDTKYLDHDVYQAGVVTATKPVFSTSNNLYTTGALDANGGSGNGASTHGPDSTTAVSGTTNSSGSGTAFSILPTYISALYVMRIK